MTGLDSQIAYWDVAAGTKQFTHPLHMAWLDGISTSTTILDYGCGYGRTMESLQQQGFNNVFGVDTSPGMIAHARRQHPLMAFTVLEKPPALDCADASTDMVLLFAVLTCIPGDQSQRRLIGELSRVLKPGGLLYLSDLLLQDDQRNLDRYAKYAERYGTYGVFETEDGAVCRHHAGAWFTSLLSAFDSIDNRRITVSTMHGHQSKGIQILARKAAAH
jgi:SAM-dependent methyltransferase